MRRILQMENFLLKCSLVVLLFFIADLHAQSINTLEPDSTKEKPIGFRRNVELNSTFQTYEEKYRDKNLIEEKKSLFPLGFAEKKLKKTESVAGTWTELNPKVPRVTYSGIHFVNKDTGWAAGDLGALIKTTDGGGSWKVIETNTTKPILKIRSYNGTIVIASGYDGLILRSTDGGETFVQVISGVGNGVDIWGLEIVNDTLGWACGATALLKTTDAGESWQIVNIQGYTGNLWAIEFLNDTYGFLAADGKVLRTTDGGTNWEIIQAGDNQPLYSIDIIDSLHIAAAGYGGTSYRGKNIYSSDGGYSWLNGGPLTFEAVNCIQYINPDTGYLVMSNVSARKTTNRGQEWTTIQGISDNYELQFIGENTGYSSGTGLKLSKAEGNLDVWNRLIINDNFSDVFFVDAETGFAISGVLSVFQGLYKTTNGGINWDGVPGPSGQDLFFLDSLTGFVGSDVIYKTIDGGTTWYIPNGGQGGAGKIFFINETIGWAIRSNVIYKTTDRGENWFEQILAPESDSYTNIFFKDSLNGWATSRFVWQTTNGGINWIQRSDIPTFFGTDIFFYENYGFAIEQLKLYKTTNNGISWFTQLNPQYIIRNFGWLSPAHGFIIGDGMYETNDSGDTWNEILELRNIGLRKFQSPKNYLGYSVGNLGLIYRYLDTSIVPVELISYQGMVENKKVILTWQTASELNNRGFQVEKSFDKENWFSIGFIKGSGTTTEKINYIFIDNNIVTDVQYYRLRQVDYNGQYKFSDIIKIIGNSLVTTFQLYPSYPNPFNPATTIQYSVPEKSQVTISVYTSLGQLVKTIVSETAETGYHQVKFDASELTSGTYIYQFIAKSSSGSYIDSKKMLFVK